MTDKNSWSGRNVVDYYSRHRNSIGDLYDSERYMLSKVSDRVQSVLDVGCATGGFYNVFMKLNPVISYTGIDISEEMILKAQNLHPGIPFFLSDGKTLPFDPDGFDLVYCSGALHMSLLWRELFKECWRVAKEYFIFDVRLVEKLPSLESKEQSYEKMAFDGLWDGRSVVPYIILNTNDFLKEIERLTPQPWTKQFWGYFHQVSPMTITKSEYQTVCMTMCCLSKERMNYNNDEWNLPFPEGLI